MSRKRSWAGASQTLSGSGLPSGLYLCWSEKPVTTVQAPAEKEEDELYQQSLEILSQYLREQVTGAKDAKPLGGSGATSRRALETLRRVGDGVQRNHKTTFQGMLRKLDIKKEDDVNLCLE
ncbi:MCL1 [Cervus elaphus hippelaphus]|uniref:MCL1 n=1 Tax=Cervus elaphus hippelaphus TaxID=46360 RepID=A0A212CGJ4_CEREH|nr:MCL1 [Cervus elaphus hippelaphus]